MADPRFIVESAPPYVNVVDTETGERYACLNRAAARDAARIANTRPYPMTDGFMATETAPATDPAPPAPEEPST